MGTSLNECVKLIDDICVGNRDLNRAKLLEFEDIMLEAPQLDLPVKHYIHGGMYGRELVIPKDTIITGQIYKFDHFDVMISGDITVSTDDGESKRFTGYNCFLGQSGKKRAGYAHEDTVWITFHPFSGVDGDQIQEFITANSFEELERFYIESSRNDWKLIVDEMGLTQEEITEQVENEADQVPFPAGYENIEIRDSKIHGKGLFSSVNYKDGDLICPIRIGDKRTLAGRYTNHAINPNAKIAFNGANLELIATKQINSQDEITVNYRELLNTRINEAYTSCQVR